MRIVILAILIFFILRSISRILVATGIFESKGKDQPPVDNIYTHAHHKKEKKHARSQGEYTDYEEIE